MYPNKITIIGAGNVGAASAYAIALGGIAREIVLIDANREKALGEAEDLQHAMPWFHPTTITAGLWEDVSGSDVVVVTAGVGRKPGQSRLDLAAVNVGIGAEVAQKIAPYLGNAVVMVVANPVDLMTARIARALDLPVGRVFGTGTALDTARLVTSLGRKLGVNPNALELYMVGEHGDSHVGVWSGARVYGIPLDAYCRQQSIVFGADEKAALVRENDQGGAEIIKRKGATYFGIGGAVAFLVGAIVGNTKTVVPVSVPIEGHYGLSDVALSLPCIIGSRGVEAVLDPSLSSEETVALKHSAEVLQTIDRQLGDK